MYKSFWAWTFIILSFFSSFAFAKSKSKKNADESQSSVSISVAKLKKRSYFSSVDKEAISLIEIGSPLSLKRAASIIHQNVKKEYSDAEKCALIVAAEIMKVVWPSETITWDVPSFSDSNQYLGIIESAKKGIYDLSSSNSDFLSILLPNLVILNDSFNIAEYYERAEKSILLALELNKESVLANFLLGQLYLKANAPDKALEYFKLSNAKYSGIKEVVQSIAKTCFALQNYELSLSFGEELLTRYPQDLDILKLCANSSYKLNDLDNTEKLVVRILLLDPEDLEYVLLRAKILMEKNDFIRASSLLDACEKRKLVSKEYYILKTQLLRDWNKNYVLAAETISKALSLYGNDIDILLVAAETSSVTGSTVNGMTSISLAEKILEKDSSNVQAMKILMSEYAKKQDYQKAYNLSSKLIANTTLKNEVIFSHIDICLGLKKNNEAMNYALEFYENNPTDENASLSYIKVLAASGQKSNAMQLISTLLTSSSSKMKSALYYERSQLQSTEDSILSDLRASLTANPRNKDSLYTLYQIYYNKKDWRRAQYYLKQAIALDSSNASYLSKNAELDKLLGK